MVGVLLAGALAAATLGLGLHVNLSPSAPRGLYHAVAGTPTRGAWVAACVIPEAAARQGLLEEVDVERRLSKLAEALDDLHTQLSGDR